MQALPHKICPLCGGLNQCSPARDGHFDAACWCTRVPVSKTALARVPPHLLDKACLCPRCAAGLLPETETEDAW